MNNTATIALMKSRVETLTKLRHDAALITIGKEQLEGVAKETGADILNLAKTLGLNNLPATIKEIKPMLVAVSKKDAEETIAFMEAKNRRLNELVKRADGINTLVATGRSAQHLCGSPYPDRKQSAINAAVAIVNSDKKWFKEYAENGGKDDARTAKLAETLELGWLKSALRA